MYVLPSTLKAVGQLAPATLLAVILFQNDTGKAQGGFVGGKVHLAAPDDFLRVNRRQPFDKRTVVQFGFIGFQKQRHVGEYRSMEGNGCAVPCTVK